MVGGRVEHCKGATLRIPNQDRLFGVARVEHDAEVIHALLVGRELFHAIRKTGPAFVERDDPSDFRQRFHGCQSLRMLEHRAHGQDPSIHDDDVGVAFAQRRERDVNVAALRIARPEASSLRLFFLRGDLSNEAVALPWKGLNQLRAAFAKRAPRQANGPLDRAFRDDCVGPQRFEQLALRHHALVIFDQIKQQIEHLGLDRLRFTLHTKLAAGGIELERCKNKSHDADFQEPSLS
jgi:hypothetical protein